jgi:predicted aspartyl protease
MLVEVSINSAKPQLFVVDTGAPHSVIDPRLVKELGLEMTRAPSTTGTGSGPVDRSYAPPVTVLLNGFRIEVAQPWVIDLSKVPIPPNVRGLLGGELLRSHVVTIDPTKSQFVIFDPASYRAPPSEIAIPLINENEKLFVEASLEVPAGKTVVHKLRIDTGSESSINDEVARQSKEVRTTNGGGGLGSDFKSYSGVFTSAKLGPYTFRHFWGPADPGPLIGMELLRRFIITFDVPHGRLYLQPTPQLEEPVPTPPSN